MKETALTDRIPQHIIQHAYDVLRNDGFGSHVEPLIVVAYLLIYLRAGYPLHRFLEAESSLSTFTNLKSTDKLGLDGLILNDSLRATNTAETIIHQIRRPSVHRLLDLLAPLRLPAMAQPEYAALFDYALDHPFTSLSRGAGQFMMPREVVQFIAQVFSIHPDESVYNPFAGTCQIASFLPAETHYFGQEPSQQVQALGALRLTAHRLYNATIATQDPWQQWPTHQQWDVILATAPIFDFRSREIDANGIASTSRADTAFVERVLQSLTEGGRAVIPVPVGFLWRPERTQQNLRQRLVESGYLQAVIEWPNGLLPGTSINFSLLLIHKGAGRANSPIWFIDATSYVSTQPNAKRLDADALLQSLRDQQENEHCRLVLPSRLATNDYNLSARRYLVPEEHHPDDIELGAIVELIRRGRPVQGLHGRFVGIRHLLGDSPDYKLNWHLLNWSALPSEVIERPAAYLSEDALLVAAQGNKLKPTWYAHDLAAQILFAQSVYALRLDLKRVDPEYLVTELNSEHVQQQLQAMQVGNTIPSLTRTDLLRLRVRLPKELAQQRAIVDSLREQLIRQKQKELEALQSSRVQKAESSQQFATLKHTLGLHQQNLSSGLSRLERVINRYADANDVLTPQSRLNTNETTTVQNTLDAMKHAVNAIFITLDRNEHELIVENFPKEQVEVISYLRRFATHAKATAGAHKVTFAEPGLLGYLEDSYNDLGLNAAVYVQANEHLFDRLLGHILNNAHRHGFRSKWAPLNEVLIHVSYELSDSRLSQNLVVRVSNNGAPFPLNFDLESLFRKDEKAGPTGNTGRGGYEAREIARYFGGSIRAASPSEHPKFTIDYLLTLPIESAENHDPDVEDVPSSLD